MSTAQEHVKEICKEAGLEVMEQVLEICMNREQVSDRQIMALDADDVTSLYWGFIGPGIDRVERQIRDNVEVA